jgi:hypothetical protein
MRNVRFTALLLLIVFACTVSVFSGCAGTNNVVVQPTATGPTSPTPTLTTSPVAAATFQLIAGGTVPKQVTVYAGAQVTFFNLDSVSHQIQSDTPPFGAACPEIDGPILNPGSSYAAVVFPHISPCGFSDGLNPDPIFFGQIVVVGTAIPTPSPFP